MLSSICIFCGSSLGVRPEYASAAARLGQLLAQRGMRLVYGAGNVGLMGVIADAALAAGGEVVGVIPRMLVEKELAHSRLTKLHIVGTMHERKALMADLSDAFIALPGGLGTLDELCEILTWAQLGIHSKPIGCLNVCGYFTALARLLDEAVTDGFVSATHRRLLVEAPEPEQLLSLLERHHVPPTEKWVGRDAI